MAPLLEVNDLTDAQKFCEMNAPPCRPWNKAQIVCDLTSRLDIPHQTARAIASTVEERIFRMGITTISVSLIKQLVWGETAVMLQAERALQTTVSENPLLPTAGGGTITSRP